MGKYDERGKYNGRGKYAHLTLLIVFIDNPQAINIFDFFLSQKCGLCVGICRMHHVMCLLYISVVFFEFI